MSFFCTACTKKIGEAYARQCPHCKAYGKVQRGRALQKGAMLETAGPVQMGQIPIEEIHRNPSGIREFDRVLGGGIAYASVVLLVGEPGSGKSTLCLEVGCQLSDALEDACKVLYVSGEETGGQVRQRGTRIAPDTSKLYLCNEVKLETIIEYANELEPDILIIDSIQTMMIAGIDSPAGSITQIEECTRQIVKYCKAHGVSCFIVGHVTKDGTVAGPKRLEHLVDAVLAFEGERGLDLRFLRAVKNRYGNTSEVGIFKMTKEGLESVDDPSEYLLRGRSGVAGSSVACAMMAAGAGSGTRPALAEVQALVTMTDFDEDGSGRQKRKTPSRVCSGYPEKRLKMLLAILEAHCGVELKDSDIYVNVAGQIEVEANGLDLPVALALLSSKKGKPLPKGAVSWGEMGLTGEVRPEAELEKRQNICTGMKFQMQYYSKPGEVIYIQDIYANLFQAERVTPEKAAKVICHAGVDHAWGAIRHALNAARLIWVPDMNGLGCESWSPGPTIKTLPIPVTTQIRSSISRSTVITLAARLITVAIGMFLKLRSFLRQIDLHSAESISGLGDMDNWGSTPEQSATPSPSFASTPPNYPSPLPSPASQLRAAPAAAPEAGAPSALSPVAVVDHLE